MREPQSYIYIYWTSNKRGKNPKYCNQVIFLWLIENDGVINSIWIPQRFTKRPRNTLCIRMPSNKFWIFPSDVNASRCMGGASSGANQPQCNRIKGPRALKEPRQIKDLNPSSLIRARIQRSVAGSPVLEPNEKCQGISLSDWPVSHRADESNPVLLTANGRSAFRFEEDVAQTEHRQLGGKKWQRRFQAICLLTGQTTPLIAVLSGQQKQTPSP